MTKSLSRKVCNDRCRGDLGTGSDQRHRHPHGQAPQATPLGAGVGGPIRVLEGEGAAGESLAPEVIAARAKSGDGAARATLARYAERMARALTTVVNVLDPDVIVLGGGMSNLSYLYDAVPRLWGKWLFSDRVATRLSPPVHGASGGVRGAAWLWPLGARA